jgi:hypothetical protein
VIVNLWCCHDNCNVLKCPCHPDLFTVLCLPAITAARSIRVNAALYQHSTELDRDRVLRRTLALEFLKPVFTLDLGQ